MHTGRNTATPYLAITGGAILAGVILFAPWPLWILLAIAAALGAALLVATKIINRPVRATLPEFTFEDTFAETAAAKRTPVKDVLLPSSLPDYHFLFSATVIWSLTPAVTDQSAINPSALAVDAVVKRAREIAERKDPSQASLVQHELAGALGEMRTDPTGRIRAMAESVRIVLPDGDRERLDKLAAVRKEEAVWEHERKYELNKREYLSRDVLKTPGSAVVWWLARNDDQVEKTVKDIGILAQLASAANNTGVPEEFHSFISTPAPPNGHAGPHGSDTGLPSEPSEPQESPGDRFDRFLRTLPFDADDPQLLNFARKVADLATEQGWDDLAEELINRYDPPADTDSGEEADDGS